MSPAAKRRAFAVLLLACVSIPTLYVVAARRGAAPRAAPQRFARSGAPTLAETTVPSSRPAVEAPAPVLPDEPRALFRYTGPGEHYGRLVFAELADPSGAVRAATPLRCERVHFAGGSGICLNAERAALTSYEALLFDREFRVRRRLALAGSPSRARVSPDGRFAAFTLFESGHSYAAASFSTRTSIVDAIAGEPLLADLERLSVVRGARPFQAVDFNYWGVTFARSGPRFYATLESGGRTHLVEGDFERRSAKVVREAIECPSLSPDGRRVAFKRRTVSDGAGADGRPGGGVTSWRIAALNLGSGKVQELAETRSVDDQVAWLDDDSILYSLPEAASGSAVMNTWVVPANGSGAPKLFMKYAYSLVVTGL